MKFTSPIFSAASGSIAGTVFSHNRSGMYTRARSIPTNPNTLRQQTVRSYLGQAVTAWLEDLADNDRTSWANWANQVAFTNSLGNQYFLTGQQAFIRSYVAHAAIGLAFQPNNVQATPPDNGNGISAIVGGQSSDPEIQLAVGGASMLTDFQIMSNGPSADGALAVFLGPPVSVGRNFWKGPYQLAVSLPVVKNTAPVNWTTSLTALLNDNGNPTAGQRRPIRTHIVYEDGRVSQDFRAVLPVTLATE